ncbi:hypothetical protein GN244_ATG05596 [Phytophthora infestans]|uniref:Uncharacterized protein n=1 Tax=Phytophthora infestans TaxID=4787 RepID=A0A833SK21_PHYIN|nr:hypothetical protein GN244_ATG05596 [Phytophthora infestans]
MFFAIAKLTVKKSLAVLMISPLKDIPIGIMLAVGFGLAWRNWKGGEMDRISRFYKWQEIQEAEKKNKNKKKMEIV